MRTYSIVVDPDAESGFTVTVPSLPGCISQGETLEECVANAQEAIALYMGGPRCIGANPSRRRRPTHSCYLEWC